MRQNSQKGEFRSRLVNIERMLCHQAKFCYPNRLRGTRGLFGGKGLFPLLKPNQRETVGKVGELLQVTGGGLIPNLLKIGGLLGNIGKAARSGGLLG